MGNRDEKRLLLMFHRGLSDGCVCGVGHYFPTPVCKKSATDAPRKPEQQILLPQLWHHPGVRLLLVDRAALVGVEERRGVGLKARPSNLLAVGGVVLAVSGVC